jgi:hypothetical protein
MNALNSIASYLPPKIRAAVYSVLAAVILLQQIWHIIPERYDGKIIASLSVLGFSMAAVNATPSPELPPPPAGGVPEDFPGEFQ